jgi:chemotaxis signal transduction protein
MAEVQDTEPGGALAGPPSGRGTSAAGGEEYCVFRLAGRDYALPAKVVVEVAPAERLVPVPLSAPWTLGLHNLRGRPLAVVDLERLLEAGESREAAAASHGLTLLVVRMSGLQFAVSIDRVEAFLGGERLALAPGAGEHEHPAVGGVLSRPEGGAVTLLAVEEIVERVRRGRPGRPAGGGQE